MFGVTFSQNMSYIAQPFYVFYFIHNTVSQLLKKVEILAKNFDLNWGSCSSDGTGGHIDLFKLDIGQRR
jgi:hypothetical protein